MSSPNRRFDDELWLRPPPAGSKSLLSTDRQSRIDRLDEGGRQQPPPSSTPHLESRHA